MILGESPGELDMLMAALLIKDRRMEEFWPHYNPEFPGTFQERKAHAFR